MGAGDRAESKLGLLGPVMLLIMIVLLIFLGGGAIPQEHDHDQEHEQERKTLVALLGFSSQRE
ncbi:MAG: hypothetical protein QOJ05_779 [Verrucomicrobiota bacterium]